MNKVLKIDNDQSVKVSAIVADAPGNSSLTFDFMRLYSDFKDGKISAG